MTMTTTTTTIMTMVMMMIMMLMMMLCRLGAHYRSRQEGTEQDFKVERIISHHSYKRPAGMAHDIAKLKLERPAKINMRVNLACLPGSSGSVSDGMRCWVTGI